MQDKLNWAYFYASDSHQIRAKLSHRITITSKNIAENYKINYTQTTQKCESIPRDWKHVKAIERIKDLHNQKYQEAIETKWNIKLNFLLLT